MIITSLISWILVPKFACSPGLPACTHSLSSSAATCCTKESNYGWRYALFTLGGLSVLAFLARFVLFTFHESPKFLVSKGRDAEAIRVVHAVARFNGVSTGVEIRELEDVDTRIARAGKGRCDEIEEGQQDQDQSTKRTVRAGGHVGHLKILFGTASMARLTALTWLCYAADYWCATC